MTGNTNGRGFLLGIQGDLRKGVVVERIACLLMKAWSEGNFGEMLDQQDALETQATLVRKYIGEAPRWEPGEHLRRITIGIVNDEMLVVSHIFDAIDAHDTAAVDELGQEVVNVLASSSLEFFLESDALGFLRGGCPKG